MNPRANSWFERQTFHAGRWTPSQLADAKGELSVSVVLPARNEQATVGAIVRRLRRDLIERVPLVEEVVVIDSGSCDETSAVAARAGARVVRQSDVLTRLGDRPGKGEALWKALLVTSGDIIAFIDADLSDFDPQFVVGLVGPLLTDTGTAFVKGFYDRPLATGVTVMPAGGGRVTEMLARPLLNLHYPELAGLVQPLAGEYAARRSLLESIPFVSGYGVEIAMLLDVLHTVGVDAMAQVDLGVRRHRNSSDTLLGQMAAQVYLAFLSRLERHGAAVFADEPTGVMTQFTRHGDRFLPTNLNVAVTERPPMRTVAEYLQRHGSREPQDRPRPAGS